MIFNLLSYSFITVTTSVSRRIDWGWRGARKGIRQGEMIKCRDWRWILGQGYWFERSLRGIQLPAVTSTPSYLCWTLLQYPILTLAIICYNHRIIHPMQFKSGSTLPHPLPCKDSHSSDSLGYLSWLQDKHHHQQSIQQTSQNCIQITSTAKKTPLNKDYSLQHRKVLMSQKCIDRRYGGQSPGKRKEHQRTEDKNVVWDDKNSNAIAAAMRCLRSKIEELKHKLEVSEGVNKKLTKQNQNLAQKLQHHNFQVLNFKCQSPKKGISISLEQEMSPIKSSQYADKIRDYEIQLSHKNTIILQLTSLIEQEKIGAVKPLNSDEMMYIEKINLLEIQLDEMRGSQSRLGTGKCDCAKLTIKYGKLLERLSKEESRSSGYLLESKEAQRIVESYKVLVRDVQNVVNKLPETAKAQLKRVLARVDDFERPKSKEFKPLNMNKSSRTLCKSKTKESRDLSSSRNNTFRKLDMRVIEESKKSVSSTPRRSKEKKMSSPQIPKLKQSKSGTGLLPHSTNLNKERKKLLKQEIITLQSKIVQIKSQYKTLAVRIHQQPSDYQDIRAQLNSIALLLQQKTEELFDKRSLLNDE